MSATFQAISRNGFLTKLSFLKLGDDRQLVDLGLAARSEAEQHQKVPATGPATQGRVVAGEKGAAAAAVDETAARGLRPVQGETDVSTEIKPLRCRRTENQLTATSLPVRRRRALTEVVAASCLSVNCFAQVSPRRILLTGACVYSYENVG